MVLDTMVCLRKALMIIRMLEMMNVMDMVEIICQHTILLHHILNHILWRQMIDIWMNMPKLQIKLMKEHEEN